MNFDEVEIECPHCGEPMAVPVDPTQGEEYELIEDCAVCCKAISLSISWDAETGDSSVEAVKSS